ncbi:MAG: hypothetical protein RLY86_2646 [Pseudomonadota bacterium]|jgi:uncharacterized integral membrane protein
MRHLRALSWLLTLPLALLVVSFAVSNRDSVALGLWPLPFTVALPAFVLVLGAFVIGFLGGGLVVWLGQHGHRKAERQHQSRADKLAHELAEAKAALAHALKGAGQTGAPGNAPPVASQPVATLPGVRLPALNG